MVDLSWEKSIARLLVHEGGYTNHPKDPGGPTNFGITLIDFRLYIDPKGTADDVRRMTKAQAINIYKLKYWNAMRCDMLPAGVEDAIFDYGVNSGIARAGRVLRRCLKMPDGNGRIDASVVTASFAVDDEMLVSAICDERMRFLRGLKTWPTFGRGWGTRVAEVRAYDLAIAHGTPAIIPSASIIVQSAGKGKVVVNKKAREGTTITIATAAATAAHATGYNWPELIPIAVIAGGIIGTGIYLFRQHAEHKQLAPA